MSNHNNWKGNKDTVRVYDLIWFLYQLKIIPSLTLDIVVKQVLDRVQYGEKII